jgi:hypothetical protein
MPAFAAAILLRAVRALHSLLTRAINIQALWGASESEVLMLRNKSSAAVRVDEGISSCVRPELSEAELAQVADLRAKAARYRLLADGLFDPGMVAVVQTCARELEAEAMSLETAKPAGRR